MLWLTPSSRLSVTRFQDFFQAKNPLPGSMANTAAYTVVSAAKVPEEWKMIRGELRGNEVWARLTMDGRVGYQIIQAPAIFRMGGDMEILDILEGLQNSRDRTRPMHVHSTIGSG